MGLLIVKAVTSRHRYEELHRWPHVAVRRTVDAVPGLHIPVMEAAIAQGMPIASGRAVPWLSGRGHLNLIVQERAPKHVIAALAAIHAELGGDADALADKRPGNPPTPDLMHLDIGCVIEIDEVQHFTTARLASLDHYPSDVPIGFDLEEYRRLIVRWRAKGDAAFAHKVSADFPQRGGRQAQRAYNDTLRDLLAPTFTRQPLIRIAAPESSPSSAYSRLRDALRRYLPEPA